MIERLLIFDLPDLHQPGQGLQEEAHTSKRLHVARLRLLAVRY